uniref:tRNA (guanine(9)-N(1))-methyltransferase n=1 Tax=Kalanchoe fedtschenkoi TaxID=63787 RepID=A0A7N0UCN3_KALFE
MWRRLFFSRPQILTTPSFSNLRNVSSTVNHFLVSRHAAARFTLSFSSNSPLPKLGAEETNHTAAAKVIEKNEAMQMMNSALETSSDDDDGSAVGFSYNHGLNMSKVEQKKLFKQRQYEARKAEIISADKERRRSEGDRKRKAWDEKLAGVDEEERAKLIEARRALRIKTIEKMNADKAQKIERLEKARVHGQNIVIDLEFSSLMSPMDIRSLTRQIMFCYAANGRCSAPSHLWLTGYGSEMEAQLLKIPGYENWIIEKDSRSYIEAFEDRRDDLIYLTPDSENVLYDIDPRKLYILGGLVDRTRQKGVTMKKARNQRIQTGKLPIREYLKESSCQILAINQVVELLLKFMETRDWKTSFVHAVPQRKQCQR